jgi:hypothetical protein
MESLKNKNAYNIDEITPQIGRVCGGGNITVAYGADAPVEYVNLLVRKLARAGYVITERRFLGKFDGGTPDFLIPIDAIRLIVGVGGEEFGEVVAAAARQKKIKAVYIPTERGFCADALNDYAVFYYDGYFMRRPLAEFSEVLIDGDLLNAVGEKSRASALGYGLMRTLGRFDGLFCDLIEGGALNDGEYKTAVYNLANDCAVGYSGAKFGAGNSSKDGTQSNSYGTKDERFNAKDAIQSSAFNANSAGQLKPYGTKDERFNTNNAIQSSAFNANNAGQLNSYGVKDGRFNAKDAQSNLYGNLPPRSAFGSAVYSALIYNQNNPDISVGEAAFIVSYITIKLYRRFLDGGMPDLSLPKDYGLWTDALSKRVGTDVIKLFKDLDYESVDEYMKRRHIAGEYRTELAALIKLLDERLPALLKKFRRMYSDAGYFIKDKIKGGEVTEAIALGASLSHRYTLIKHIDEEGLLDRYLKNNA